MLTSIIFLSPAVVQDTDGDDNGVGIPGAAAAALLIDEGFVAGNIYNTHTDLPKILVFITTQEKESKMLNGFIISSKITSQH